MSLTTTSLVIESAPVPETFNGTPNDFRVELVKRLRILSPNGTNFIFIGSVEPTSNVGPWLKNGTQWFVWDPATKRYVPLDVSASVTIPFFIGASTPATSSPPVWLLTDKDQSEADPSVGNPIGWYVFNGTAWVPYNSIVLSGPTASRPAAPVNYQQYYDTDIGVLIWWERSAWRTIAGVPGDVKFVAYETLTEALNVNPGWALFGAANQDFRGRLIVQAAKDSGTSPVTSLPVDAGITPRGAFEFFGESQQVSVASGPPQVVYPAQLALWTLVKT